MNALKIRHMHAEQPQCGLGEEVVWGTRKFVHYDHEVFLEGKFSMSVIAKFAFCIEAILFAVLEIMAIDAAVNSKESLIVTLLAVFLFLLLFLFMATIHFFLKWLLRGDVKWITDTVTASLE